jgi:mitochondrial translocator assembly and maintenance protein 41
LAGRLHKPVKILRDEPRVRLANQVNLESALRVALLLLPEEFTEFELYTTIAGLSYMGTLHAPSIDRIGDFRTRLPTENPKKVYNIVSKQVVHFRRLYSPLLDTLPNISIAHDDKDPANTVLKQDFSPTRRSNMVARLPSSFKAILYRHYSRKLGVRLGEVEAGNAFGGEFEMSVAADQDLKVEVKKSIREIVGWVSFVQTVKGLLTAGLGRSVKYVFAKVGKWWSGSSSATIQK